MYGGDWREKAGTASSRDARRSSSQDAFLKILEQPASKFRFRYKCEGSSGTLTGASCTASAENKTFPTVKICGYTGRAVVVVSCVASDAPYRPHPHSLMGRDGCTRGVCTEKVLSENMTASFTNLGIQCVKRKDIEAALRLREEIRVDPFRTGFRHRDLPSKIDLNAVRLCFQAFLESEPGKYTIALTPVVSNPIVHKRAATGLLIVKLSDGVCPADGGQKDLIILCEKVVRRDIRIRFYEEKEGRTTWEAYAEFEVNQVHYQTAIWFRPPKYHNMKIEEPVGVYIQLQQPSDGKCSDPYPFDYLPLHADPLTRKRKELDSGTLNLLGEDRLSLRQRAAASNGVESLAASGSTEHIEWNIPFTTAVNPPRNGHPVQSTANGISSLLSIDSHQLVTQFKLNSRELASYNVDVHNLSESFSSISMNA